MDELNKANNVEVNIHNSNANNNTNSNKNEEIQPDATIADMNLSETKNKEETSSGQTSGQKNILKYHNIKSEFNANEYVFRNFNIYIREMDQKLWISLDSSILFYNCCNKLLVFNELFYCKFKSQTR